MKDNCVPLYTSHQLGKTVSNYAEQHSTALPKYLTDYHADISANRNDSNYMSSLFQSQYHTFLAKSTGAKRGKFERGMSRFVSVFMRMITKIC